jgi:mannosyl-3-phosphoglycerate synthase
MYIDTVHFPGGVIDHLEELDIFFSRAAFIISHKGESLETLLSVLWYLPASSYVIIVSNCPLEDLPSLAGGLRQVGRDNLFLVHQKDPRLATFFREHGVTNLLGADGLVNDGKGEGMYIGTLCATLLGGSACEWVIFYDADNFVPCALLEYTLAMARLFLAARAEENDRPGLHNVRICWASKPFLDGRDVGAQVLGRCSQVVSPLVSTLFAEVGGSAATILTSNAGEQGMTLRTARTLRFSSRYSVETFQLLDLFAQSHARGNDLALFQQYQARSPHFHQKGDVAHIQRMIAESLGCFPLFAGFTPFRVEQEIHRVCAEMGISPQPPRVYPALDQLDIRADPAFLHPFFLPSRRFGRKPLERELVLNG